MEMYLVSYQKQGSAPVVYVASEESLMATINQALKESDGVPVLVSSVKTI
nr:MAG TPA: hypothetical protein [Microviridae sp.]